MASTEPTVNIQPLQNIPWVRYVKQTSEENPHGMYRVVTDVGLMMVDGELHTIQNSGFDVTAITSASDYGLCLYVTPIEQ